MSGEQTNTIQAEPAERVPLMPFTSRKPVHSVKIRLITQFIGQFAIVGLIALTLMAVALFFMLLRMAQLDMNRSFTSSGLQMLIDSLEIKEDQMVFNPKLLAKVKESGGLAANGRRTRHRYFILFYAG